MYPILLDLKFVKVYSYAFFLGIGFYMAITLALSKAKKAEVNEDKLVNFAIAVLTVALITSRLLFILLDWENINSYIQNPSLIFKLEGLVFYGGFIGAVVTGLYLIKKFDFKLGVIADIAAPSVSLGLASARIGCFLNGCCYGKETASFLGMKFLKTGGDIFRHPTQLYSSIYALILIFVLEYIYKNKKKFDGFVFICFLIIYGVLRFLVEILRGDDRGGFFLNNLFSISQLISIGGILLGVTLLIYNLRKQK